MGVEGFEPPTLPPFGAGCSELTGLLGSIKELLYSFFAFPPFYLKFSPVSLRFIGKLFRVPYFPIFSFRSETGMSSKMLSKPFFNGFCGMSNIISVKRFGVEYVNYSYHKNIVSNKKKPHVRLECGS